MRSLGLFVLCTALAALGACNRKSGGSDTAGATASATASAAPSASARREIPREALPIPSGPVFAILRGEGIGPIRFGATVKTVERHMQMPCEYREPNQCRYVGRAAEFFFNDAGALTEIRLHRVHRPAKPAPRTYGMFNGRFPEGVQFGMLRHAIRELLGEPKRVEPIKDGGPAGTVEVFHYDDMRLEFDKVQSGDIVLGGVTLIPTGPVPVPVPVPSASAIEPG